MPFTAVLDKYHPFAQISRNFNAKGLKEDEIFMEKMKRNRFIVLALAYLSFLGLGSTTAFNPAQGDIMAALNVLAEGVGRAIGLIVLVNTLAYSLSSATMGYLSRIIRLEKLDFIGATIMGTGFLAVALSPNLTVFLLASALTGIGAGLIDSSMNTYMSQHFTARHINWMYSFMGTGSALGPALMTQMIIHFTWRAGYFVLAGTLAVIAVLVLISAVAGVWKTIPKIVQEEAAVEVTATSKNYLTKKWHKVVQVLTCFLYGGMDLAFITLTSTVLIFLRGMDEATAGAFIVTYFVSQILSRLFFGWLAKWVKNMIRLYIGVVIAFTGLLVIWLNGSIAGIAMVGFGFAPMFPSILHEATIRFDSETLKKLVGFQISAFSAGIAIATYGLVEIIGLFPLAYVGFYIQNFELLFPATIIMLAAVLLLNLVLNAALKRANSA